MQLRRKLALAAAVSVIAASSITVLAVKYGVPDNNEHPYVGLVVFYKAATPTVPEWRCTGTLISPTVLLTAAHCTELNGPARVWFDEEVTVAAGYPDSGGVTGTANTYPAWAGMFPPNTGDVGVVLLDEPVYFNDYPDLAPVGYLDALAKARGQKSVNFKVVGYGLQAVKPFYTAFRQRLKAWVQLVNLNNALTDGYNIQTTNSQGKGTGTGGICLGDSGGSIFNEQGQIVAVNSFFLNDNCAGVSFGFRVDTPEVQEWIQTFLN